MSNRNSRYKQRVVEEGGFVQLPLSLLESPPWCVLSHVAIRVLNRLMIEYRTNGGYKANRLVCTYAQFEAFGIRRKSVAEAINELAALKLVEVVKRGTPSISTLRKPSEYRLTFLNGYDGREWTMPTDEWRQIQTLDEAKALQAGAAAIKSAAHKRRATVAAGKAAAEVEGVKISRAEASRPRRAA